MRSPRKLFIVTALAEAGTGLFLVLVPAPVVRLLLGVGNPSAEALVIGRVFGACLIAVGVACWMGRNDQGSRSRQGLLWGVTIYDAGASIVLLVAGLKQLSGVVLWPAVLVHMGLTTWCMAILIGGRGHAGAAANRDGKTD